MLIGEDAWALLERVAAGGGMGDARALAVLEAQGLLERAGGAARLTGDGTAAVAFRAARDASAAPCPAWLAKEATPGFRELSLTPGELDVLRIYASLPARPGAADLSAAVAEAHYDPAAKRWLVQVADADAAEVGRALWLDALSGQVTARNRLARHYGIRYEPTG